MSADGGRAATIMLDGAQSLSSATRRSIAPPSDASNIVRLRSHSSCVRTTWYTPSLIYRQRIALHADDRSRGERSGRAIGNRSNSVPIDAVRTPNAALAERAIVQHRAVPLIFRLYPQSGHDARSCTVAPMFRPSKRGVDGLLERGQKLSRSVRLAAYPHVAQMRRNFASVAGRKNERHP